MDSVRPFSGPLSRALSQTSLNQETERSEQQGFDQEGHQGQDSFLETTPSAIEMSEEEEQAEGERQESELLAKYGPWSSAQAFEQLQSVFAKLEPKMKRDEVDYDFALLDTDIPFASSCTNGAIFVSRGLFRRLSSEGVLFFCAHELAHTELRHYATRQRRLGDLRANLSAPPQSPSRMRLEQAAVLSVRHQEEFEADAQAAEWLSYPLAEESLRSLFTICRDEFPSGLRRPTHPAFENRIRYIRERLSFPSGISYLYSLLT